MSINRGYLNERYRLFHSTDRRNMDFQSHSHDFHKVIFCLSGKVTYTIEGSVYALRAWDILLVPEHQIHHSVMTADEIYERIILWINDDYLRSYNESALSEPFQCALRNHCGLLRPDPGNRGILLERLAELEKHLNSTASGHALMADTYLIQFILELNRIMQTVEVEADIIRPEPRLQQLLDYINAHLGDDLSVQTLASLFYYSPSYLMHTFKRCTGYTVHRYITEKRLLRAADLIVSGMSIASAAELTGFPDYSAFQKSFRSFFGVSPGVWRKSPSGRVRKQEQMLSLRVSDA